MKKQGVLYNITGLAGVGKTTMGEIFYKYLKERRNDVVFMDGDILRGIDGDALSSEEYKGLEYTKEYRIAQGIYVYNYFKLLLEQNINIVYCTISLFDELTNWRYEHFENNVDIYIETPMEILKKNNKKNLYSGEVKDVVGMDIPFDMPKDITTYIHNDFTRDPEDIVKEIIEDLRKKGKLIVD